MAGCLVEQKTDFPSRTNMRRPRRTQTQTTMRTTSSRTSSSSHDGSERSVVPTALVPECLYDAHDDKQHVGSDRARKELEGLCFRSKRMAPPAPRRHHFLIQGTSRHMQQLSLRRVQMRLLLVDLLLQFGMGPEYYTETGTAIRGGFEYVFV